MIHSVAWRTAALTGIIGLGLLGAADAQASDFTITGDFSDPNDVLLIDFTSSGGAFIAFTSQRTNAPQSDPLSSFDPEIQLFTGTGPNALFLDFSDDGCSGSDPRCNQTVGGVNYIGGGNDAALDFILPAGEFTLGLTNDDNRANGPNLSDGYDDDGDPLTDGTEFRVHLLGVEGVNRTQGPVASVSGPFMGM